MAKQIKEKSKAVTSVENTDHELEMTPELVEAINSLRPEQRSVIVKAIQRESFSGPIPHPDLLQKYEEVQQGFAERIVSMAERQLDHRVKCEDTVVNGSVAESKRGQCFGLIVAVLFLGASLALGLTGHDWLGGVLGGGTLVALVTVFVQTKHQNKDSNGKESEP